MFGALLNGAALCRFNVVSEGFGALPRWLESERITFYSSVPTVFRQFATLLTGGERFDTVRVLHVSGERVTAADFGVYKRYFAPSCLSTGPLVLKPTGVTAEQNAETLALAGRSPQQVRAFSSPTRISNCRWVTNVRHRLPSGHVTTSFRDIAI